jgi:hypothetical protein
MARRIGCRPTAGPGAGAAARFAAQVAAAWAEGESGWERLIGARQAPPADAPITPASGAWWDGPPWHGKIAEADFRAIVAAYVARYGVYTPELPLQKPRLLRTWLRRRRRGSKGATAA